ncbi:MAG: DUF2461 family protein [Acidobacteriota bacterium]
MKLNAAGSPSRFVGFSPETFQFLADLAADNTKNWFAANRRRFIKYVDRPLRALVAELGPFLQKRLPELEITPKCGKTLSRINKNIYGRVDTGLYNTEYWAAFYRRSLTKQTDIQLLLGLRANAFEAGLYCSYRASALLDMLRDRILANRERFLMLLQGMPFPLTIYTDEARAQALKIETVADLEQIRSGKCLALVRRFTPSDEQLRSHKLVGVLEETFELLLPLYELTSSDQSMPLSLDQVLEFPGVDWEADSNYDLDDLKHDTYLDEDFITRVRSLLIHKKQIIFYGPPGTGKTYIAKRFAQYFLAGKGEYKIIQFHPSYAYEDFIEGIRPETQQTESGQSMLTYTVVDGIFKKFSEQARASGKDAQFILIVDEINRGNLSKIFGELLYLLEYRDATVELPYSKKSFNIPANLFIIGTMNTADRSIALVDHALRRRFHFIHLAPDVSALHCFLAEHRPGYEWIAELLARLNRQLEAHGISREYHIGHSHFMSRNIDDEQLRLIWEFTIMPTIEEYFHNRAELVAKYDLRELCRGLIDREMLPA